MTVLFALSCSRDKENRQEETDPTLLVGSWRQEYIADRCNGEDMIDETEVTGCQKLTTWTFFADNTFEITRYFGENVADCEIEDIELGDYKFTSNDLHIQYDYISRFSGEHIMSSFDVIVLDLTEAILRIGGEDDEVCENGIRFLYMKRVP